MITKIKELERKRDEKLKDEKINLNKKRLILFVRRNNLNEEKTIKPIFFHGRKPDHMPNIGLWRVKIIHKQRGMFYISMLTRRRFHKFYITIPDSTLQKQLHVSLDLI